MTRSMSKYIFAVYSCFHNSVCRAVSPEEVAKDIPVQRPVAKVTPLSRILVDEEIRTHYIDIITGILLQNCCPW